MKKIITLILIIFLFVACNNVEEKPEDDIPENIFCNEDQDCVPEQCCHPTSCINQNYKQDCSLRACTMDCKPGTMDCGQGSCICQNNKCIANIG